MMRLLPTKRRTTVIVAAVVAMALGGGVALAYWTTAGSGTGTASTGKTQDVVINQTSTVTDLAPGSPPQVLSGNFDNPNPGPVYVTVVKVTVAGTDQAGCDASDYTIGGAAPVGADIPAGNGVGKWSGLTIAFNNKATNQDACKGATVKLAYTSS